MVVPFNSSANADEKENADGVRGHLEAVGDSNHKTGVYEKVFKRLFEFVDPDENNRKVV